MSRIVHSGIVGLGAIGPSHCNAIANIPNAKLAAVCDLDAAKAEKFAAMYSCKAYTDYAQMLADPQVELVHICVPSGMHADLGVQAAQAGKHVLVEKPIDITLEAADRLIEACDKAGVLLSCISQNRFADGVALTRRAVEQGKFGTFTFGGSHTKWYRTQAYYDSGDWRGTWELDGGGALMNQSVHYVDLLQYLMGPVREVFAYCATRAHERIEVEDVAAATLLFENGAVGLLEGNTAAFPGFYTRLDINGSQGSVIIQSGEIQQWRFADEGVSVENPYGGAQGGDQPAIPTAQGAGIQYAGIDADLHQRQVQDVIDAITQGREPAVTGRAARHPLAIILAVYESARTGRPVQVR